MNADEFERLIAPAVSEVLESMFFSEVDGVHDTCVTDGDLLCRVTFCGEVSGILNVRISKASARSLSASFLGEAEESLSETQVAQVICELANMLCGWIVSRTEWKGVWKLDSPELLPGTGEAPGGIQHSFGVEHGMLTVSLSVSVPA